MRIKKKRFVLNRMKFFYFKEKLTTPLPLASWTLNYEKTQVSVKKTYENERKREEHIQDVESLARKSLCKADSRNVSFGKSAATIFRFSFFNLVFKNTKIR